MGKQRMPKVPHGSKSRYENELKPPPLAKSERVVVDGKYEVARTGRASGQLRDYQKRFMELAEDFGVFEVYEMKRERFAEMYGAAPKPRKAPTFCEEGDVVEALRDGQRDPKGLPKDVPIKGERYRVVRFYIAGYGVGVVLANMDESIMDCYPYKGYVYAKMEIVDAGIPGMSITNNTFYFKKVE